MIKQTLLKVLILLLFIDQIHAIVPLNKFKSNESLTDFIETPTRYIIINQDKCDEGLSCDNVAYYEINKKTGKTFKIARGETINIGPTQDFKGYSFTIKEKGKELFYTLRLTSYFVIMHPKTYQIYSDEEVREY